MSCILILENLRSPNSTVLVHFCRVLKIKHTANRIFAVCFIEAHGKGDGRPNGVPGRHLCRVSYFRHTAKCVVCHVPYLWHGPLGLAHGISLLCRVLHLCRVAFLVAHGKPYLCHVPDVWATANVSAHGKRRVSVVLAGSCGRTWLILCVCVLI